MAQLLSVNVGLPREIEWKGKTVRTAVWKDAVRGRRKVDRLNIDGDGQGDLQGHGGEAGLDSARARRPNYFFEGVTGNHRSAHRVCYN